MKSIMKETGLTILSKQEEVQEEEMASFLMYSAKTKKKKQFMKYQ